jgi:hypothetical protein
MKILTKEEEDAHYAATLEGGLIGTGVGLALGLGTALPLNRRWMLFKNLTLPFKAFYVSSFATFGAIVNADRYSRAFEAARRGTEWEDEQIRKREARIARMSNYEKFMYYGRENRYKIVLASWAASMGISLGLVYKDKYLTKAQKLVQARMYAQGLTLLVLVASAAFEVSDSRTGKKVGEEEEEVESYAGENLWKDIIRQEEAKQAASAKLAAAQKH